MKKRIAMLGVTIVALVILGGCTPNWRRNQAELDAQNAAQIAVMEAEYNAEVMRLDAEARLYYEELNAESILLQAEAEAQAEVIRARGIADAMYIIQEYITDDYLIHFWIRTLGYQESVIYVATESGLPIFPEISVNIENVEDVEDGD